MDLFLGFRLELSIFGLMSKLKTSGVVLSVKPVFSMVEVCPLGDALKMVHWWAWNRVAAPTWGHLAHEDVELSTRGWPQKCFPTRKNTNRIVPPSEKRQDMLVPSSEGIDSSCRPTFDHRVSRTLHTPQRCSFLVG